MVVWSVHGQTNHLNHDTDWIDVSFVQRKRTPREILHVGIRHYPAGVSFSITVILLEEFGVSRSRTAIHDWVKKADLQPAGGDSPDHLRSIRR